MRIVQHLEDFIPNHAPITFTIGNFDGVHRGHQMVLRHCHELTKPNGQLVVLTFSNHPSEILRPGTISPLICPIPHRLSLLEQMGVETVIIVPFTATVATYSASSFLEKTRQFVPFSHLVLGYDAVMGKDREGNQALISSLAHKWDFKVDYLPEYRYEGTPVSSTLIRRFLQEGNLAKVEDLLGRPYSLYATSLLPANSQNNDNDMTFCLPVAGLCLPPPGIYEGWLKAKDKNVKASACLKTFSLSTYCTITFPSFEDSSIQGPIEFIFQA